MSLRMNCSTFDSDFHSICIEMDISLTDTASIILSLLLFGRSCRLGNLSHFAIRMQAHCLHINIAQACSYFVTTLYKS